MYQPPHFREERRDVLVDLIRRHPLALLISYGGDGLTADLLPFLIDVEGNRLVAHMSKANPQFRILQDNAKCMVVFQGPDTYITPNWYATKAESGRVVPTWNYAVVQVTGEATIIDDLNWLRSQVESLTDHQEATRADAWKVSDAPDDYVQSQLRGIVGIEIAIESIEGKWKVSQNKSDADQNSVVQGLITDGHPAMAEMVSSKRKKTTPGGVADGN